MSKELDYVVGAAFRLLPNVFEALRSGMSEGEIRQQLARNRAEMDQAFADAEARINAPREADTLPPPPEDGT